AIDERNLADERHPGLAAFLAEPLDAAQEHRAAVGYADRCGHGYEREFRQLDRRAAARDGLLVGSVRRLLVGAEATLCGLALRGRGAFERELLHIADLAEERHYRQAHIASVVGDDRLDRHERTLIQHDDYWLLRRREVAHDGDDADDEWRLGGIRDERL